MKVTTFNLAGYKNWSEREANIVSYLNETASDVVFFQEVKFDSQFSPQSQAQYINSKLKNPYPFSAAGVTKYYQPSHGEPYREGLAVLSSFPIIESESLVLTKRPDDKHTRIIQNVCLQVGEQTAHFTNVHFSNNQYSAEQLKETLEILRSRKVKSVVLGDFNIFDLGDMKNTYADLYEASSDVKAYVSFPSENLTLDYILVPKPSEILSLTLGEGMSDHNALTAELDT